MTAKSEPLTCLSIYKGCRRRRWILLLQRLRSRSLWREKVFRSFPRLTWNGWLRQRSGNAGCVVIPTTDFRTMPPCSRRLSGRNPVPQRTSLWQPSNPAAPADLLTPQPVPGSLVIPFRCWIKIAGAGREMLAHHFVIQAHTQARPIRDFNPSVIDDRCLHIFLHQGRPPGHVEGMVLKGQEIFCGRGAVNIGHTTDRSASKVHGHGHAVFLGHVSDFVGLEDSAGSFKIGMNLADGMPFT